MIARAFPEVKLRGNGKLSEKIWDISDSFHKKREQSAAADCSLRLSKKWQSHFFEKGCGCGLFPFGYHGLKWTA